MDMHREVGDLDPMCPEVQLPALSKCRIDERLMCVCDFVADWISDCNDPLRWAQSFPHHMESKETSR